MLGRTTSFTKFLPTAERPSFENEREYVLRIERGALGSDTDKCLGELEMGKVTTILGRLE
jgi:hypothetical protein